MNLSTIKPDAGNLLYQELIDNKPLVVRELANFRWFHFGGESLQSVLDLQHPQRIVLPVYQSMLLFLLWKDNRLAVLNLGMGGGALERALSAFPDINVTSVEQSSQIIALARNYFLLPPETLVYVQSAQQYLEQNHNDFDIVLCDVFIEDKNSSCINERSFYQNLQKNMNKSGIAFINLSVENEQHLLDILAVIHQFFSYSALVEFTDYKNIVLIVSDMPIPGKKQLNANNKQGNNIAQINFARIINGLYHLK